MKCPICRKKEVSPNDRYAPFCSDRCRIIDLGNWASGKYAIPGAPAAPEGDEDAADDEAERP
jgi:endogenous inhibitor of DNA gyrase (YacG/DUF329 family)